MKKVLIITYYWPPAGGSGVQRWLKFVKYFREFGIEPIVYTVKNGDYPIIDESLESDIPSGITVLTKSIFEPNSLLSILGGSKKQSAGFMNPNPTFYGKIMQYIRANYFIPDSRFFWINPSVKFLKPYIKYHKIDTIISTGPPHSTHLIAQKLKEELNIKWIADFRDPWTEIDYFHQLPLTESSLKKHSKLEKNVLNTADAVVVVGKTMKNSFEKETKKCWVISNGFDQDFDAVEVKVDDYFTLTHVGLMNADRNHPILWEVISKLCRENEDFKEDFILKLIGKVDQSVINSITQYNLKNQVELIDYVPHAEVIEHQKRTHGLLVLVNNVPSAKGILTGKIFEYLIAKKPIIAIAPENGDLSEILTNSNAGVCVNFGDAYKLEKEILRLYSNYKNGVVKMDSKNTMQYHRKNLTEKMAELIGTL